ncbi:SusC/RagA family TonB-linked outer membrane protein [Algivirga pacifica]|uniref:SusC/RagA family TonB-linked outer membrane protein n=2 Tax=Algivirga pacifica TaxID=1162670 RepID=A0ABP9DGR4_9BACT
MLTVPLLLLVSGVWAQDRVLSGTVRDAEDNITLIGVNVVIKGTTIGTVTDFDGNYKMTIPYSDSPVVLEFSMIGYEKKSIVLSNQTTLNVSLTTEADQLDEVVVTAFGIEQEKKALNYAVQRVAGSELQDTQKQNVIESLSGKVAGVQVSTTSGSPGAGSFILIRGMSSIAEGGENQPLFVVDGIPVRNERTSTGGNSAMDIDMNDVENVSVLKGGAAAALYGLEAANGVVLITTKSGKTGKTKVSVGSTTQFDMPLNVAERQSSFLQGTRGLSVGNTFLSWGPLATPGDTLYQNNTSDFFDVGVMQKYNLSVSGGNEKVNFYTSANFMDHQGVVPTERYKRIGLLAKGRVQFNDYIDVTTSLNYIRSNVSRLPASMYSVYNWPYNDEMANYLYPNGEKRWLYDLPEEDQEDNRNNPYWLRENNSRNERIDRLIGQAMLNYKPTSALTFSYRLGTDISNSFYRAVTMPTTAGNSFGGAISDSDKYRVSLTSTFNISYDKQLGDHFRLTALIGNNYQYNGSLTSVVSGEEFLNPGFVSINNLEQSTMFNTDYRGQSQLIGGYADIKLDYKGIAYMGASYRRDWASTLPQKNSPFDYPSVSAGFVFSELLPESTKELLSYGKIHGNYATVGKIPPPYSLTSTLEAYKGINNGYNYFYQGGNPELKPEETVSWEIGADMRFFNGKTHLEATLYEMSAYDQIIPGRVSPSSGYIIMVFNSGSIRNRGIEVLLDHTLAVSDDFTWDASLNFTRNKSRLIGLPDHMSAAIVTSGQVLQQARPGHTEGEPIMGVLGTTYLRDKEGNIVVDERGYPRIGTYQLDENGDYIQKADGSLAVDYNGNKMIGNREPDWMMGLTNTFKYKGWSLGVMMNFVVGGDVVNATASSMYSLGTHHYLEQYRNQGVVVNGVVEKEGGFEPNTTTAIVDQDFIRESILPVGENFVEDGTSARLEFVRLGYTFNKYQIEKLGFDKLSFNVTAKNLLLLTKYSGADPNTNYGGVGTIGLDNYGVPLTRSLTVGINASF